MKQLAGVLIIILSITIFFGWIFVGASAAPGDDEVKMGLTQHEWMTRVMVGWGILFIVCSITIAIGGGMIHEHANTAMGIFGAYLLLKGEGEDDG